MTFEYTEEAKKKFQKLDTQTQERIKKLICKLEKLENPRSLGGALQGKRLSKYWKYREGKYRLICDIQDDICIILCIDIGKRDKIYQ